MVSPACALLREQYPSIREQRSSASRIDTGSVSNQPRVPGRSFSAYQSRCLHRGHDLWRVSGRLTKVDLSVHNSNGRTKVLLLRHWSGRYNLLNIAQFLASEGPNGIR